MEYALVSRTSGLITHEGSNPSARTLRRIILELNEYDVKRFLIRSMDRLKEMAEENIGDKNYQARAFLVWHDKIVKRAQELGILPEVKITARTELGKKHGGF